MSRSKSSCGNKAMTPEERAQYLWEVFIKLTGDCRHWPGTANIAQEIRRAARADRERIKRKNHGVKIVMGKMI